MKLFNQLYINGIWENSSSNNFFDVINPATQEVITQVASASETDIRRAIDAAEKAMNQWAKVSVKEKSEVLRRGYELILANEQTLATTISLENGKSYADSLSEVRYSAEFFRWFSAEVLQLDGHISNSQSYPAKTIVQYKPAGIAAIITPWNFPAAMATRKIAPAIAAGCSVLVKPAKETPLTMLALMPLLEKARVPAGLINILPSSNAKEVADIMLSDNRIRVLSFTGSTEVGKNLLKQSANQVLNPAMELGGNAPFIVFEDADIEKAVDGLMIAKMRNMGEACTAANRIYLQQSIHDEFVEKFTAKMKALKIGNPADKNVEVGALVNRATLDKVDHFVNDAISKGAKLVLGGKRIGKVGYFYEPTILINVPPLAEGVCDEIFGPVAMIQKFENEQEVIDKANNTIYGLVAYVFTKNLKRGLQVSEALEFGMVGLNRGFVSDPAAPFGGVKQSGIGREGGKEGIYEFTETQYISVDW